MKKIKPRVSIVQCVSTAIDMLKFSTESLYNNAGYDNFDYVVVVWLPSKEVMDYLNRFKTEHDNVHIIEYMTNPDVGYVPNLRGMMNSGFDYGFKLNNYCGLVNTDQCFYKNWLLNLVRYVEEDLIVNSVQITPIQGQPYITENFGITEYDKFNLDGFEKLSSKLYNPKKVQYEDERGGWFNTNTMPYLFHKKYWDMCGPWELTLDKDFRNNSKLKGYCDSPDSRFFERCYTAGATEAMCWGSITYHHEAVERRGKRPEGTEHMVNEDGINGKT